MRSLQNDCSPPPSHVRAVGAFEGRDAQLLDGRLAAVGLQEVVERAEFFGKCGSRIPCAKLKLSLFR